VAHGIRDIRIPRGSGLVGACIDQGTSVLVNDVEHNIHFLQAVDDSSGYRTRSVLCVPMKVDGEIIGAVQVLNKPGGFSPQDVELLQLVSLYAASAIQSERLRKDAEAARLLRHELEIARNVQQRLLPQTFTPAPNLEYSAFCRPARSVGGDYYDALQLPDGGFGFTLGDVSGKGVPAALLMASIHTLLRSLLAHKPTRPADVVAELNSSICGSASSERFSTLFCGVLNHNRDTLTYVNAGHIAPFILHANGTLSQPSEGDLPVGLLPSSRYHQHQIPVQPGDLILLISDGLLDLEDTGSMDWDSPQIEAIIRKHQHAPLNSILGALAEAVDGLIGSSEQFDDMSALIVRIDNKM
jgi:sigma-B regulation protein RsbU (phosphoserine phosphatase)